MLKTVKTLVRCLSNSMVEYRRDMIIVSYHDRHVIISHDIDENRLVVRKSRHAHYMIIEETHHFPLDDPRSIGAAMRCMCRITGQNIPSFEYINETISKGPPSWMLEDMVD